jgi:transposase-like protein
VCFVKQKYKFYKNSDEISKAVYTTNTIGVLNFQLRKVTRNKPEVPNNETVFKVTYQAIRNASKKWTMPIRGWGAAIDQFAIAFGERIPLL